MEEAAELANYLPLLFRTPKQQEYIEFPWPAFLVYYMLTNENAVTQHRQAVPGRGGSSERHPRRPITPYVNLLSGERAATSLIRPIVHSLSVLVAHIQNCLGREMSLRRGLPTPSNGLGIVLPHPTTGGVHDTETSLSLPVPLLRC